MKTCKAISIALGALLPAAAPLTAGNVVTDWTTIASTTIVKNGGKAAGCLGGLVRLYEPGCL